MASINLLLLTWNPRSGQQGASSVSVQRERLSEKTGNAGCDSLNTRITNKASEGNSKKFPRLKRSVGRKAESNRMVVKLIGWAGNLTSSGPQFCGVLIA